MWRKRHQEGIAAAMLLCKDAHILRPHPWPNVDQLWNVKESLLQAIRNRDMRSEANTQPDKKAKSIGREPTMANSRKEGSARQIEGHHEMKTRM